MTIFDIIIMSHRQLLAILPHIFFNERISLETHKIQLDQFNKFAANKSTDEDLKVINVLNDSQHGFKI